MLSVRTCTFSDSLVSWLAVNGIHVPAYGHEAQLTLALALYSELYVLELAVPGVGPYDIEPHSSLGSRSEWAGYLQSLPRKTVPIGLFWGYKYSDEEIPEREAIDWKGNHELRRLFVNPETGVERLASVLYLDAGLSPTDAVWVLQTEIREFYETVVKRFLSSSSSSAEVDLRGYHHAYSLVASRAFLVDGYHGLSMVPIADR